MFYCIGWVHCVNNNLPCLMSWFAWPLGGLSLSWISSSQYNGLNTPSKLLPETWPFTILTVSRLRVHARDDFPGRCSVCIYIYAYKVTVAELINNSQSIPVSPVSPILVHEKGEVTCISGDYGKVSKIYFHICTGCSKHTSREKVPHDKNTWHCRKEIWRETAHHRLCVWRLIGLQQFITGPLSAWCRMWLNLFHYHYHYYYY